MGVTLGLSLVTWNIEQWRSASSDPWQDACTGAEPCPRMPAAVTAKIRKVFRFGMRVMFASLASTELIEFHRPRW
jgi:hypothetical protein